MIDTNFFIICSHVSSPFSFINSLVIIQSKLINLQKNFKIKTYFKIMFQLSLEVKNSGYRNGIKVTFSKNSKGLVCFKGMFLL